MRNTARWAAALGLTAVAVCGPLTGAAVAAPDAAPASLYAPAAGAELRGVGGDFAALKARDDVWCNKLYDPVVVTAQGVWQGQRVSYERTFGNSCERDAVGGSLFAF